jgi:hypothetical protein
MEQACSSNAVLQPWHRDVWLIFDFIKLKRLPETDFSFFIAVLLKNRLELD